MEGRKTRRSRRLVRCHLANRLEGETWVLVYEQVWPLIRRAVSSTSDHPPREARRRTRKSLSARIA